MNKATTAISALCLGLLILDAKTAMMGAGQGISLCLQTLVPSLFPFFVCSILLTAAVPAIRLPWLGRLLRLPEGLWILGLLGGYPVGAQAAAEAGCREPRVLPLCNNAGPAFIFGIGSGLLGTGLCWAAWGILILSSLLTAITLPGSEEPRTGTASSVTVAQAIKKATQSTALVCSWVVLMQVILAFLQRWTLWWLPQWLQVVVTGVIDLASGCFSLHKLENLGLRFLLFTVLLSFGGLCVALQTFGVKERLSGKLYFPGKLLQSLYALLLCIPAQLLLPMDSRLPLSPAWVLLIPGIMLIPAKRTSSILRPAAV